jgi:multiple sugar transport system ATP-binding protein
MAKVSFENITKRFGNFTAVKDFNLEIKDHEFVCLVGPSGCGKTTTLRMLAGLDDITEGSIKIGDLEVNNVEPKDREIAMVFQSYALYPHYNVYDNLAFGLRARAQTTGKLIIRIILLLVYIIPMVALSLVSLLISMFSPGVGNSVLIAGLVSYVATIVLYSDVRTAIRDKIIPAVAKRIEKVKIHEEVEADIKEKVTNAALLLNIDQQLNKKPKQLSGGQRQRVALGRAIVRNPKVFLLDEPLSNLDAKLRVQMRAELQRLSQKLGVTTIYVTHDQIEAMTLGHRIAILNEGILQQVGSPDEVYLRPTNKFVAGFIGSPAMNFLHGKIEEKDGGLFFTSAILDYKIPDRYSNLKSHDGKSVYLGIRPEHIIVNPKTGDNRYKVIIGVIEPIGSDTFIYIDFPKIFTMIVKMEGLTSLKLDEEVEVTFNTDQIHFFESESELRIKPKTE